MEKIKIFGLKLVSAVTALLIAGYSSDSNPVLEQKLTMLIVAIVNFLMAVFFVKPNGINKDDKNA